MKITDHVTELVLLKLQRLLQTIVLLCIQRHSGGQNLLQPSFKLSHIKWDSLTIFC